MDENGRMIRDVVTEESDAPTFSNVDQTTSDAQAMGGNSTLCIWGTNISVNDTMASLKRFLREFSNKYRMWADGMTQEETQMDEDAETKKYMVIMQNMMTLGVTCLSLDFKDLKAFPPTQKLWQQAQDYPQDIVSLMDQAIKDMMFGLAEEQMAKERRSQSSSLGLANQNNVPSSDPPVPSSDRMGSDAPTPRPAESAEIDWTSEVQSRNYRVRLFGLDETVNMRDLNPSGMNIFLYLCNDTNIFFRCGQNCCYQRTCYPNNTHSSRYEGCLLQVPSL